MFVVCTSAFIYPFPTLLLIAVMIAISKSQSVVSFDVGKISYELPLNHAIFVAIGLAIIAYALNFFGISSIIKQNIRWQNTLFSKIINQTSSPASLSQDTKMLPGSMRYVMGQATRLVGAAALIGRLLSNGLYNAIVCLVCILATLYLNYKATLTVFVISVVFLPLYARYFRRVSNVRTAQLAERLSLKDDLKKRIETQLSLRRERRDLSLPDNGDTQYQPFYAIANQQYLALNSIRLLVAFHFFTVLAALIVILKPQDGGVSQKEFFLFGVLVILIRAGTGLLALMGNLTRNYENLSELRNFLFGKKIKPVVDMGPENGLSVRTNPENFVVPGQPNLLATQRPRNITDVHRLINSLLMHTSRKNQTRDTFYYCRSLEVFQTLDLTSLSTTGAFLIERGAWHKLSDGDKTNLLAQPFVTFIRLRPCVSDERFAQDTNVAVAHSYAVTEVMSYSDYGEKYPTAVHNNDNNNGAGFDNTDLDDDL